MVDTLEKDPQRGPESVGQVFRTQRRCLLEFIRGRLRSESDAEDVLQDVFYQLLTSPGVTEPIENLTAWLLTVARNKIFDLYRKRHSGEVMEHFSGGEEEGPLDLEDILFDPRDGPELAYWKSSLWSELTEALEDLPDEQRAVFLWHELEGLSFKEMAERTGESVNTLLSRKRYAVKALRKRLRTLYDEMENL